MNVIIGIIVMLLCMLGGFAAMAGTIGVLWQPWSSSSSSALSMGTFIVPIP